MHLRILIAEDHQIVREALRALLEREGFDIVGEAGDGREAVNQATYLKPDVAVLDLTMPKLNGIDAAREMRQKDPSIRSIILTVHSDGQYVQEALRAGIQGYVLKTRAASELTDAIEKVAKGETYLSPEIPSSLTKSSNVH